MFRKTQVCKGLMLAFGTALTLPALGQEPQQQLERVEITGSAIKRITSETALPVQVLTKKDIERSGATSTNDLLQRLPAMQNSTIEGSAVGGVTFGFGGVSVHNIGETRTLVLLNGHRISKFGGQAVTGALNAIDLNTLPISAIERVEILTDGASALYGADAVAGVVNFITARRSSDATVTVGVSNPTHGGSEERRFSITKGFGNYETDGFNFSVALSGDKRGTLAATQREFAKTGLVTYTDEDGEVLAADTNDATSKRSVPANLNLYSGDTLVKRIHPTLAATGACPPYHIQAGLSCRYDFTSQLEIYPDRERVSAFASFDKKLDGGFKWFNEVLLGKTKSTSRIAPTPGELPVPVGSAAYNHALAIAKSQGYYPNGTGPTAVGDPPLVGNFDPTTMDANLRFTELGKRTSINEIQMAHLVTGIEGNYKDWDFTGSLTHSENTAKETYGGGYASVSGVVAATFSPFDPFLGQQTADGQAALEKAKIGGYWNGGKSKLDALNLQASTEIGKLEGGPLMLALGGSAQHESLDARPSDLLAGRVTYAADVDGNPCAATGKPCVGTGIDQKFGDSGIQPAYKAGRTTVGVFAELGAPVTKQLELTASARFDRTSDFGNTINGKVAARLQPTKQLLIRGSVGSGYIAPSLAQVNAPQQNFGVTQSSYSCSGDAASDALQALANALGVTCDTGTQFQQYAKGNLALKPERSKQLTLGVLYDATSNFSVGADWWAVKIIDAIGQKSEQVVFADPTKYASYFTTFVDPATGKKLLAFLAPNENLGNSITSGIDFSATGRLNLGGGRLTSTFTATYLLKSASQQEKDGLYFSDIANEDQQQNISLRLKGKWINTFDIGAWSTTLGTNFQSGYLDSATSPSITTGPAAGDVKQDYRVKVKPFVTFDLAATYNVNKMFSITAGAINLTDKNPPFVFSQGGLSRGQEVGWDGRYFDPRGRTLYVNAVAKF